MLSFRQTCRYIFYILPLLKLSSKQSDRKDIENINEFCKLIAINNLIQELNQAYGIQSLLNNSCLEITLDGYYSINYTDPFVRRLNAELSNSTNLIHKEFISENIFNRLMKTLDETSLHVKQIFDFTQDFWSSPADVFEVTDQTLDTDDPIIRGLTFDNDNANLLQAIEKPLNPQFRTRFRPLICLNIDGRKRIFTTSWMVREAIE